MHSNATVEVRSLVNRTSPVEVSFSGPDRYNTFPVVYETPAPITHAVDTVDVTGAANLKDEAITTDVEMGLRHRTRTPGKYHVQTRQKLVLVYHN